MTATLLLAAMMFCQSAGVGRVGFFHTCYKRHLECVAKNANVPYIVSHRGGVEEIWAKALVQCQLEDK